MVGGPGGIAPRVGLFSDGRWITGTVALFAIAVFTYTGSRILPLIIAGNDAASAIRPDDVTGFLLNIALIVFSWKRSVALKRASAERDAALSKAHDLAYIDEVTGLFNRRYIRERIAECQAAGLPCALFLLDLDRFKRVNDLYGHAVGDAVLTVAAKRLRNACPPDASCARLGGDEFAVFFAGDDIASKALSNAAEEIVMTLHDPVSVKGIVAVIGGSIGIAIQSKNCKDPGELLKRADIAMYEGKRRGRNCFVFFDSDMEIELVKRNELEADIRRGIRSGEFVPYFQPILDLRSEEVVGFEVLARWLHPDKGMLEPSEFIAIAEDTSMISDLSLKVMQDALEITRDWPSSYKIAVNVSPMQFNDPMIAERLLKVLTATGFPPARLELEISEKCLLTDLDAAMATVTSLKNVGIGIAVDDFGKGYLSLTQLQALPFDRIKIDHQFILSLEEGGTSNALVKAVATLGKGLKLPITVEGVENAEIRNHLADLGCENAQGWLYSKALTANEVRIGFGFSARKPPEGSKESDVLPPEGRLAAG
ncbi:EAL domain-containing protein [Altererythrobacter salegens]|uniref:EAL domain-containing protein n=1 Tax=Croceibacterium salegens TaxID=1737568 RepID=A0A6I4ST09_9SPHN|nr:EAL domain-containing protein [Croceibacterium salegens]MXO59094.1 EAL domain-containing protein [Croceibacterium salegens]